jgi:hypothetical protein
MSASSSSSSSSSSGDKDPRKQLGGMKTALTSKGINVKDMSETKILRLYQIVTRITNNIDQIERAEKDHKQYMKAWSKTPTEHIPESVADTLTGLSRVRQELIDENLKLLKEQERIISSKEEEEKEEEGKEEPVPERIVEEEKDDAPTFKSKEDEFKLSKKHVKLNKSYKPKEAKQIPANEKFVNKPLGGLNSVSGIAKYTYASKLQSIPHKKYTLY